MRYIGRFYGHSERKRRAYDRNEEVTGVALEFVTDWPTDQPVTQHLLTIQNRGQHQNGIWFHKNL